MPIFAPYTGQRISPIPSGYLAAEGQRAKMLQQGMASLGRAFEGWGKQKGEDTLRDQKLQALMSSFEQPAEQGWSVEDALSQATEKDVLAKEKRRQNLAEDRAKGLYGQQQKFDEDHAALLERHKKLNEQADVLKARSAGAGAPSWARQGWEATLLGKPLGKEFQAKEQAAHENFKTAEASVINARQAKQELAKAYDTMERTAHEARPFFLSDEGFFDFRNEVADEAADLKAAGLSPELLRKKMLPRIDPTSGLPYTEDRLAHLVELAMRANKAMDLSNTLHTMQVTLGDKEEEFKAAKLEVDQIDNILLKATEARDLRRAGGTIAADLSQLKQAHEEDKASLLQEYLKREEAPVTTAQDAVFADMDKFRKQVEVAPAGWDPRLLEVLGPKLLKKAESGNLTRGDTRVAIEKLENLLLEDRAARSQKGQLMEMQMSALKRQERERAASSEVLGMIGRLGGARKLESQKVTPEWLIEQVRGGKMTPGEADRRLKMIVEHMRGKGTLTGMPGLPRGDVFDFGMLSSGKPDPRGKVPYSSASELKTLEERREIRNPAHDILYADAWKTNPGFQGKHGHLSPEEQERIWGTDVAEKSVLNFEAREAASQRQIVEIPQEMQQNFERALTGAESREQAIAAVDDLAFKLGPAGHKAALAMIDERFPPAITTEGIPDTNTVLILRGTEVIGTAIKPTPLSTTATPILDPQGRPTGKMLTADGKMVDDPGMPKEGSETWVEVKGLAGNYKGQAQTKAEAVAFRARYTTALEVVPKIDALLLMTGIPAKELADLTGRDEAAIKAERDAFESKYGKGYDYEGSEVELYGPMRQDADALVIALTGMLRVAVTGPGAMTKEEAERIAKLIANPYEYFKQDMSARISLRSARAMMINSVDAFAQAQGIQRAPVGPAQPGGGAPPRGPIKFKRIGGKVVPVP